MDQIMDSHVRISNYVVLYYLIGGGNVNLTISALIVIYILEHGVPKLEKVFWTIVLALNVLSVWRKM